MKKILVVAVMLVALGVTADVVTNSWIGADGAAWGTAANWSAGHVPDGTEYVIFPDKGSSYSINVDGDYSVGCFYVDYRNGTGTVDITLTGSGRITGTGTDTHYLRTNRRLVLESGVTLDLSTKASGKHFMLYNGLVVKAGATNLVDALHLHWNGSYVHLAGGTMNTQSYISYRLSHTIRIDDGSFLSSSRFMIASDASNPALSFVQNGGYATVKDVELSERSSVTMNGGTFQFRAVPSIADDATLNFNGGTNDFAVALTDTGLAKRFLCGNEKTAVKVSAVADLALLFGESCTVTAPLSVAGGVYFTNAVTVTSTQPVFLGSLFDYAEAANLGATVKFPAIVLNGAFPFRTRGKTRNIYIEGPMTFRATADITSRHGTRPYPFVAGDITIDTRDWNDASTTHTIMLEMAPSDDATLTIRGGGTVQLIQHYAVSHKLFRSVVVEDGTTLTLIDCGGTDGRLHTDKFVLGPNTTLNLDMSTTSTTEFNALIASKWEIDPTARINVTLPSSSVFTTGATAILQDEGSDSMPVPSGQITYSGDQSGTIVNAGSSLMLVRKTVTEPDGAYTYEWTGNGTSALWSDAANWSGQAAPPQNQVCAFGACDTRTTCQFDQLNPAGSTVGNITFRGSAVSSFRITGKQLTYSSRATDGGGGSSICSYSAMPQTIANCARSTSNISFTSRGLGSVELTGGFEVKDGNNTAMYVTGDIRCRTTGVSNAGWKKWGTLQFVSNPTRQRSRFFQMAGDMTFFAQTLDLSVPQAGIRVAKGATLTFLNGLETSRYKWTAVPQLIVVDGTLDIQAPFIGGVKQYYGGEGTLKIALPTPSTAASRISFADTLSVEVPAAWPTVNADGAETPLALGALGGRPVIHAANGWTYGPAAGTETTTASADRAAYINAGATLAVEPGGGVATFVDPVAGPGTLEITNGTLKVTGGISSETSLAVAANGAFAWDADAEVAGLSVAPGGTLAFSGGVLTVADDVSLADVTLQDADNLLESSSGWQRILVAKSVSGTPDMPPSWETQLVELESGMVAFEVHDVRGTTIIFR